MPDSKRDREPRPALSADAEVRRVLDGQLRAIATLLSRIEDGGTGNAIQVLKKLHPHTGGAFVIGVTGSPGVGKSTLVDRLADEYLGAGSKVAVIAVDPSSPFSGGALLGDRVRMRRLAAHPSVFVRSMATRGRLGGLSDSVPDAIFVLDAAGYDVIIVETVGVGQDEIDIAGTADLTLVVVVPGMGDDVQAAKAGVLEIADIFVLNKADLPGAERTEAELRMLSETGPEGVAPIGIVPTVATEGEGISQLVKCIARLRGLRKDRRQRALKNCEKYLRSLLRKRVSQWAASHLGTDEFERMALRMMTREADPYTIVEDMMKQVGLEG